MALWKPEVDDDGETAWHECEPEDTVAQAGLVDGDKLMVISFVLTSRFVYLRCSA
jgi:hypothetical protein